MKNTSQKLVPLQFAPLFKNALWGGNRLLPFFGFDSQNETIGEAWVLSDYGQDTSKVVSGPFGGLTLRTLMSEAASRILGFEPRQGRFPLLLKFIDALQPLSVQVHPTDELALELEQGGRGKTEAWVILDRTDNAKIYAGLRPGVVASDLFGPDAGQALHSFKPEVGECVFLRAGTAHAIGEGVFLFEVQQTSDFTYRLYDWGRVDPKTGLSRELHIEKGIRSTDFSTGPCPPVPPIRIDANRERLTSCEYFSLDRIISYEPFSVGSSIKCQIAICLEGSGSIEYPGGRIELAPGVVALLPVESGEHQCIPSGLIKLLQATVEAG